MQLITDISKFSSTPSTVTIGTFDGVHRGHLAILKRLISVARKSGTVSTLLTFHPHPRIFLKKNNNLQLITTLEEKANIISQCGVEQMIVYPFNQKLANMEASDYVQDILVKKLNAKKIIVGYDHHFGKKGAADIKDLERFGKQHQFEVHKINVKEVDKIPISSTKIRKAILDGDFQKANMYLGREFSFSGKVSKGEGVGKTIGFPTANLIIDNPDKICPKDGVYAVKGIFEGKNLKGMMNIGRNPTLEKQLKTIEIHWFNFHKDIYDKKLEIKPILRIRDEQKFDSLEKLKYQIQKDQKQVLGLI